MLTTADLLDDDIFAPEGCELIDGEPREKPVSMESDWISLEIAFVLKAFCRQNPVGWVITETAYRCFPHRPRLIRKPDVSFVRRGRFPNEVLPRGDARIAPDLAVEVVSPNDIAEDLEEKMNEFFGVGVSQFWVAYPLTRTVYVYRADGSAARRTAEQEIDGGDVLPGFAHRVGDFFPPPPTPPATE